MPVSRPILISNGHGLFSLRLAAAEMADRGNLAEFITGGYPTEQVRRLLAATCLDNYGAVQRLLKRRETSIPEERVHAMWLSEALIHVGQLVKKLTRSLVASQRIDNFARGLYARQAVSIASATSARLYHYRSGYGHASVHVARARGIVTLCEHSIAHPAVLGYLVSHGGHLPPEGQAGPVTPMWHRVLRDVDLADHVLVNSDFVKSTFLNQGWDGDRVHVIYRGVDDQFMAAVPHASSKDRDVSQPLRLLFAGGFERRKGADTLMAALAILEDESWTIDILGKASPDIAPETLAARSRPRVMAQGFVSRTALARYMANSDIFVFPSLAEGSARVIYEAMACGCYVITTPNSGSIVEDGIHGALVPPGDESALSDAIREAICNRSRVRAVGERNADLIRNHYRQANYGNTLAALYEELIPRSSDRDS